MKYKNMKKLIDNNNSILYYYDQGFKLGYEEAKLDILYKMASLSIDTTLIAKTLKMTIQDVYKNLE